MQREIGRKFAELGFGTVQTDEEYEKSKKKFQEKKKSPRHVFCFYFQWIENDYLHATIHCVSCSFFCSKRIGYISSFGLIAGVYYLYQSFCAFKSGIPFGEIGELNKAVCFIIFPFVAYLVSYVYAKKSTFTFEEKCILMLSLNINRTV